MQHEAPLERKASFIGSILIKSFRHNTHARNKHVPKTKNQKSLRSDKLPAAVQSTPNSAWTKHTRSQRSAPELDHRLSTPPSRPCRWMYTKLEDATGVIQRVLVDAAVVPTTTVAVETSGVI
jgi:hypothetical protein